MKSDSRLDAIKNWLTSELKFENFTIEVASADASFRRYFRLLCDGKSWIIMDAPPDKEDCRPFVHIARLIESAGVHAPHIFNFNEAQGFMLLSDLGSTAYLDKLNNESADSLYFDAIQSIVKMQTIEADIHVYDKKLLQFEMSLFSDWYIARHLGLTLDEMQTKTVSDTFSLLTESALQQTVVFVHRDYHSRNLMITDENNPDESNSSGNNPGGDNPGGNNPGVIDFQDAVNGPPTYDLVSLIKDCYIAWPREKQLHWVDQFLQLSPIDTDRQVFIKQLDLMGLQRHLKAIGIFARLNYRDGKSGYLKDIPRTLAYVIDACQRYEELQNFMSLLKSLNITGDVKILELIGGTD